MQKELQLLSHFYNEYLETTERTFVISFLDLSPDERNEIHFSLEQLEKIHYIQFMFQSLDSCQIRLTSAGIEFAQNGYRVSHLIPTVSGNNNIVVTGANNIVSHNYNQISTDIEHSDLPEEYKEMIETFLYEIRNARLTSEKKSTKIKAFLSEITAGTISEVSASGLCALLSALLKLISS